LHRPCLPLTLNLAQKKIKLVSSETTRLQCSLCSVFSVFSAVASTVYAPATGQPRGPSARRERGARPQARAPSSHGRHPFAKSLQAFSVRYLFSLFRAYRQVHDDTRQSVGLVSRDALHTVSAFARGVGMCARATRGTCVHGLDCHGHGYGTHAPRHPMPISHAHLR
jgi:hypothetical protein